MISDTSSNAEFQRVYNDTPKEKANYLVDTFSNISSKKKVSEKMAIEQAVKAVDELIKELGTKYWYEVRAELLQRAKDV